MRRHSIKIQNYEQSCELSANKPAQFLRFIKKVHLPQTLDTPGLSQHCPHLMLREINMEGLIKLLNPEVGKRKWHEQTLSLNVSTMLYKNLADVCDCKHISYLTSDRVWISEDDNITLIETTKGSKIYGVLHLRAAWGGIHTVNNNGDFFYIGNKSYINMIKQTIFFYTEHGFNMGTQVCVLFAILWRSISRDVWEAYTCRKGYAVQQRWNTYSDHSRGKDTSPPV